MLRFLSLGAFTNDQSSSPSRPSDLRTRSRCILVAIGFKVTPDEPWHSFPVTDSIRRIDRAQAGQYVFFVDLVTPFAVWNVTVTRSGGARDTRDEHAQRNKYCFNRNSSSVASAITARVSK